MGQANITKTVIIFVHYFYCFTVSFVGIWPILWSKSWLDSLVKLDVIWLLCHICNGFNSEMGCRLESGICAYTVHYSDVIMGAIASQITSIASVYSTVYSGADQRKHQSSVSLAFVGGIHRWPVNSPRKWPVTRKRFPFDEVIMV